MTQERANVLSDALAAQFTAHVEHEEVAPGRFRFDVFSKHYGDISHLSRQDRAWEVVDRTLSRDESEDITLVITHGPEEVSSDLVALMP